MGGQELQQRPAVIAQPVLTGTRPPVAAEELGGRGGQGQESTAERGGGTDVKAGSVSDSEASSVSEEDEAGGSRLDGLLTLGVTLAQESFLGTHSLPRMREKGNFLIAIASHQCKWCGAYMHGWLVCMWTVCSGWSALHAAAQAMLGCCAGTHRYLQHVRSMPAAVAAAGDQHRAVGAAGACGLPPKPPTAQVDGESGQQGGGEGPVLPNRLPR